MTVEFTKEEAEFLKAVLDSIQISGTHEQVRQTLVMIDAILAKIKQEPKK